MFSLLLINLFFFSLWREIEEEFTRWWEKLVLNVLFWRKKLLLIDESSLFRFLFKFSRSLLKLFCEKFVEIVNKMGFFSWKFLYLLFLRRKSKSLTENCHQYSPKRSKLKLFRRIFRYLTTQKSLTHHIPCFFANNFFFYLKKSNNFFASDSLKIYISITVNRLQWNSVAATDRPTD